MKTENATKWIINYIHENKISISQTSLSLNIPESKLRYENEEAFSAAEFLELCCYLNISPEKIQKDIGSYYAEL